MEAEQERSQVSMEALTALDDAASESNFHGGGGGGGGSGCASAAASSSSLMEKPPPPFVLKTYDMVNAHNTNSIISWNSTGTSLIVWDAHRFAAEVMTRYFKHNNFSNFVCQLNTYGFKKISYDRWEFQNEWFQRGKMSWLKNIKRRNVVNSPGLQKARGAEPMARTRMLGTDHRLENLKNERNVLNQEIALLNKKLEDAEKDLDIIKTEMEMSKIKQQKMVMIVARAFLEGKKEGDSVEIAKKPRLIHQERTDRLIIPDDLKKSPSENVNNIPVGEESRNIPSEISVKEELDNANNADSSHPVFDNKNKYQQLENLLLNDLNTENVAGEEMANHQSKIIIELEDLIGERVDWAEYVRDLGDKASCLKYKE